MEVVEKAYVSTAEITEYDRVLESLLKDRITTRTSSIVKSLSPTRRGEPAVTMAIDEFTSTRPQSGQLQIIQGAVGSGKSIFIRRYKEFLQPSEQIKNNRWSFINFLGGPVSLKGVSAQEWLCRTFCESFYNENLDLDPSLPAMHRGIYSRKIQQRKPIYEAIEQNSSEQAARLRAEDMIKWQDNHEITARGLSEYILGSRQETLITVMDNVDKLGLQEQLDAFELSLWFLNLSKSFVILQMRDETYERFKDRPPLDTYRASVTFHITPPRFIDVVKPRLDLGIAYLLRNTSNTQTYELDNGLRVTYPNTSLGEFIRLLYAELFGKNRNVARLMDSLAGTDVRRALEIFSSIITSGHLSTNAITSVIRGEREFPITEVMIVKMLMRTEYKLFSSNSGFLTNILYFDNNWEKPDNFIAIECLFYLTLKRSVQGQIGIEGFFTCEHIAGQMQVLGYSPSDTLNCLNFLLERDLISADHQSKKSVSFSDTVRVLPAGFMHLRVLPEHLEYCFGIIPTTPIVKIDVAQKLANVVEREISRDDLVEAEQVLAVEILYNYLVQQLNERKVIGVQSWCILSGAEYFIERIRDALVRFYNAPISLSSSAGLLDGS